MTDRGDFLILLTMLVCCQVWATDFYVATDGNDGDPGTFAQPFATLEHALVDAAGAGDTIYIRGGSYHEEIVAATVAGALGNPITITNYNDEVVTMDGSEALSDLGGAVWTREGDTNIYKTTISKDIWQLWIDGRMGVVARWPNVTVGHPCDPIQFKADHVTPIDGSWWDLWGTWGHMDNVWNASGILTNDTLYHDMAGENVSFAGGSIILNFHSESQFARPIVSHTAGSNNLTYTPVQNPHDKGQGHFLIEANAALDMPGEWYYNKATGEVRLWCEDGQTPQGRDVRGKTISYALDIADISYVTIKGIDFFGCALNFPNGLHVTIEDCDFSYPTWYRRMLGIYGYQGEPAEAATQPPETGSFFFKGNSTNTYYTIRNCKFEYSDGVVYMKTGYGNQVDNCLFHHFSFTGMSQMVLMANSNKESVVKRSTFHTNGSKVMLKHTACDVEWSHFMYFGYFQMDGTAMQCAGGSGAGGGSDGTVRHHNWHHQAYKTGCRWDGNSGVNGTDHHFVSWNNPSSMNIKGDYHKVISNTSVALHDPLEPGIKMTDANPTTDPKNQNSDVYNNLAGGISSDTHSYVPLTGNNSNNWNGFEKSTGPSDTAANLVRDVTNWDFRPKAGSEIIDAGIVYAPITDGYLGSAPDIGAYEYGDTNYWIPGRQEEKACTPIPPNGSPNAKPDCDLMWLAGRDAISHDVYFGTSPGALAFQGNQANNIFDPGALTEGQRYYWRIDTVTAGGTITGDEWSFTVQATLETFYTNIYPIADTYTRNDNPNNNYGTDDKLSLATHTDGREREGYMKFDIDIPGTIINATLNLYATGKATSGNVQVYSMTDTSWDEMALNYNNAPPIDGVLLDQQDIYSKTYRGFDVADAVTGNGVISFGLDRSLNSSFRSISSRENANSPYLTIAYTSSGPSEPPPDAPTNLTAVSGIGQISLDWDDNTEDDLNGYQVLRRQNPEDNFAQLHPGVIRASDYVDTTMLADLPYQYIVKAVDMAGQYSFQSNIATATATSAGGGIGPIDDTTINSVNPDNNWGDKDSIRITADQRYCFFKFDITGFDEGVRRAVFRVRSWDNGFTDLTAHPVTGHWQEETLTWNLAQSLVWGDAVDTVGPIDAQSWYDLDVGPVIAGNGEFTIGLKTTALKATNRVYTRESQYVPQLILTPASGDNTPPVADAGQDAAEYALFDELALIELDGSGSYDPEGDTLSYLWTWTIDDETHHATGVNPTIELPIGKHVIELVVNDWAADSEPDTAIVTVLAPVRAKMMFVPRAINRNSGGMFVCALLRLPRDMNKANIMEDSFALYVNGDADSPLEPHIYRLLTYGGLSRIFVVFNRSDFIAALPESDGTVRVDLIADLTDGGYLCSTDTIRTVTPKHPPRHSSSGRPPRRQPVR